MKVLRNGHPEPSVKKLKSMPKSEAKKYLAKEKREAGKGEPKSWHKKEMKILSKKSK